MLGHLTDLPGADARISLEVRVAVPGGVKEEVMHTVTENARSLGFTRDVFEVE